MPRNADAVIRYEDVFIDGRQATIEVPAVTKHQNIHMKGEDRTAGSCIITPGVKISSPEIGVCATVGKSTVRVSRFPKTIIISTGDELVDIHEVPEPHQIRRSNVYRLKTVLSYFGVPVETAHLKDDESEISEALDQYLKSYDLILISGGVSRGKFDFLPAALEVAGVKKLFHKIKQRPGKPFWFGVHDRATVFAFPGNPVSSFMCMQQYFKPWLQKCLHQQIPPQPRAMLTEDVHFKPDLTYFLEVKISYSENAELLATPVKGNGSGDLANLVDAEAFIVLPSGKDLFQQGEVYPLIFYRE
jgi:molybdopterin molybdotransferase